MAKGICDGRAALGPCDKRALYWVNGELACGLHLAQIVKFNLTFKPEVIVRHIEDRATTTERAR